MFQLLERSRFHFPFVVDWPSGIECTISDPTGCATPDYQESGAQTTTILTSFLGITITFLIVLPSIKGFTFSDDLPAASSSV